MMNAEETIQETEIGAQMSFLEHLDELRKRLVRSVLIITAAFVLCWTVSDKIYNFLAVPVQRELAEATQRRVQNDDNFTFIKDGDTGRYVFDRATSLGSVVVPVGTTVLARVSKCAENNFCINSDEDLLVGSYLVPKGVKIAELTATIARTASSDEQLIVTTATEPFTLYVTVSLYAAIAVSVPFLLWQIWAFIAPALYRHERKYVTPFIGLSTISFVLGAAFAYYILFPPAVRYLLWLGEDFRLMLRATDYFDFITLIMLAMGLIFQMPAITYVLARIGLVNAGFLAKSWKFAIIIILIAAAVISPTGDIPNMMLFATPMMMLYVISIFVAWLFGKKRVPDPIV
ncbi:MAG: twin-arginine translocase subunit TatC [Acidobacteria bacterium]|nr:twin-arginine translocase subunit TatC [Acidobacteriota bacterium]